MLRIKQLKIKGCRQVKDISSMALEPDGLIICDEYSGHENSIIEIICNTLAGKHDLVRDLLDEENPDYDLSDVQTCVSYKDTDYTLSINSELPLEDKGANKLTDLLKRESLSINAVAINNFAKLTPQFRYKAFSEFLNMGAYADFEATLEVITAPIVRRFAEKEKNAKKVRNQIRMLLDLKDTSYDLAFLNEINHRLTIAHLSKISSFDELKGKIAEIDRMITGWTSTDEYINILNLKSAGDELMDEEQLWKLWEIYSQAWEKLHSLELNTKEVFFEEVLTKGLKWVTDAQPTTCPLCENVIDANTLQINLQKRIENNSQIAILRKNFASASEVFFHSLNDYVEKLAILEAQCVKVNIINPLSDITKKLAHQCDIIVESTAGCYIPALENIAKEQISTAKVDLNLKIELQVDRVINNHRLEILSETKSLLAKIETILSKLNVEQTQKIDLEAQKKYQEKLNEFAAQAKKTAIEKLIISVAGKADSYLKCIYGQEIDKKDPNSTIYFAQTGATLDSIGHRTSDSNLPDHYNENNMATLGLCIFLAIKKHFCSSFNNIPLLFIDKALDITDPGKREQIAELIFQEFSDCQIIISTSDIEWVKQINKAKDKTSKKLSMKFDSLSLYSQYRRTI